MEAERSAILKGDFLRLLAERKKGYWLATCLELDLMAIGKTPSEAFDGLKEAIEGYLETVCDTDDPLSARHLLDRPAPLSKKFWFHLTLHSQRLRNWWKAETFHPHCNAHA
jgi:Uncharacterized conserved protein